MTTDKAPSVGEFVAFLDGTKPLEGAWFGSSHPSGLGPYWWRKYLPMLAASPSPGAAPQGDAGSYPRHGMSRRLELAADAILERAPELVASVMRDGAQCIDVLWNANTAMKAALASQAARMGELENRISEAEQILQSAGPWVEIVGDALKALRGEN